MVPEVAENVYENLENVQKIEKAEEKLKNIDEKFDEKPEK